MCFLSRVARWFIFKPKIPIWVNLLGPWNGECWHVFGYLENFTAIWNILWQIGNIIPSNFVCISPLLVHCVKKNLANLFSSSIHKRNSFRTTGSWRRCRHGCKSYFLKKRSVEGSNPWIVQDCIDSRYWIHGMEIQRVQKSCSHP
jgi:hypothetical protein